jgi:hypothetical protein
MVAAMLECLLAAAAPQTAAAAAPSAGTSPKLLHASISDDCLCAIKLGLDNASACCSPKACSDVTPATSGARLDAAEQPQPQQEVVQPLVLLSALLDSKLLPQAHRLLQQLPQQGYGVQEAAAASASISWHGSASSAVQVPVPRGSKDAGARVSMRELLRGTCTGTAALCCSCLMGRARLIFKPNLHAYCAAAAMFQCCLCAVFLHVLEQDA